MADKIYPFNYVNLGSFWVVKVNPNWVGISQPGVLCIGSSGLFETGQALESGVDRQFKDGTVLPTQNIISGKRFSMKFYFIGTPNEVFLRLRSFQNYTMREVFKIDTDRGSIKNCRGQQVTIDREIYDEDKMIMEVTLDLISSEPMFSFLNI